MDAGMPGPEIQVYGRKGQLVHTEGRVAVYVLGDDIDLAEPLSRRGEVASLMEATPEERDALEIWWKLPTLQRREEAPEVVAVEHSMRKETRGAIKRAMRRVTGMRLRRWGTFSGIVMREVAGGFYGVTILRYRLPEEPGAQQEFSRSTRRRILEAAGYRCRSCGTTESLEVDHIVPAFKGGLGTFDNGQVLCHECHRAKTYEEGGRLGW